MDERDEIIAAQYGGDDLDTERETERLRSRIASEEIRRAGRTVTIRFPSDGKEIELPTVPWVKEITRLVEDQKKTITRLDAMLRDVIRYADRLSREIDSMKNSSRWNDQ